MNDDIIAEVDFLKALIDANLEVLQQALETEESSDYNRELKNSTKIVENNLRGNSFRNCRVDMPFSNYHYEDINEHTDYLIAKNKELRTRFIKYQNKFTELKNKFIELENQFNISRTTFLNRQQAKSNKID